MEIICEDLFVDTENNQPLNKLRARKGGCKRLCSELSVPYIELAMNSLVLQDTILNIPAWARLDHNDTCDTITGPEKRSANDSLQSGLPHKKSKCSEMHTSATQILDTTRICKTVDSCTSEANICQPNLPPYTGLHATYGGPQDSLTLGCNNNNSSRTQRRRTSSRCRTRRRIRRRSQSCSSNRSSRRACNSRSRSRSKSRSRSRSRSKSRRKRKGILKRSRSRKGSRRGRRRSKRRVRFSRKITIWE